jgi:Family of unknown function (DUF6364)
MPLTKLTLSADKALIKQAKELAVREGTSLSSMFSRFLRAVLAGNHKKHRPGPVTRRATGLAKLPANKSDRELLEDALAEKYER